MQPINRSKEDGGVCVCVFNTDMRAAVVGGLGHNRYKISSAKGAAFTASTAIFWSKLLSIQKSWAEDVRNFV